MSDLIPELDNKDDINTLLNTAFPAKVGAGIGKALQNATLAIVNARLAVSAKLGYAIDALRDLNASIKQADKSSTDLAKAIKNATVAGVIVAGISVFVALLNLAFDVFKYFYPPKI